MIDGIETLHLESAADGRVLRLRMEHGKANEMGSAQLDELDRLSDWLASHDEVRALVSYSTKVTSRGTPIFVAGANVKERTHWSREQVMGHVRRQRATLARLRRAPVFHVAVVSGMALGWGSEFLLTADYRIATPGARFGLPETGLGILPGAGGTSELADQIGLAHALRLGMTGERIDALEAVRIGLVQELADSPSAGLERAQVLAAAAATRSPTANATFKRAAIEARGHTAEARTHLEAAAYEHCVRSGEAAIGRDNFDAIRKGGAAPWGPRRSQG